MKHLKKSHSSTASVLISALLFFLLCSSVFFFFTTKVNAADSISFVFLSKYEKHMDIGETFYLVAITTNGKPATFVSNDSSIASVDSLGRVKAKKAGETIIRAKSKGFEACCRIKVRKTEINLNTKRMSLEVGETAALTATTSNGAPVKWKSQKSSIASIDENGMITAKKPGETTITVSCDGSSITCSIKVKKPKVTLSDSTVTLYRKGTRQLSVKSTSTSAPVWKSNRRSIATVDDTGKITAVKHGSALITVTVDGVSKTCEVTVKQPEVTLNQSELSLTQKETFALTAKVSSGNKPEWSSSNTAIATVNSRGVVTAQGVGKAYIYATEDGVKARCSVYVTKTP